MSGSPESINTVAARMFADRLHVSQQQRTSRLRGLTIVRPFTAGKTMAYDGLGLIDAIEITGTRFNEADFSYAPFTRRKVTKRRFFLNLPIDRSDVDNMVLDPTSPYVMACVRAINRVYDKVVLESAFADVATGEEFGTSVTFADDGGATVTATAGLTYEKILELNANYKNSEANADNTRTRCLVITGEEEEALMQETELISGDFRRQMPVENGELVSAVGNKLIIYGSDVTSPLLGVSSGTRSNVSFIGGQDDSAFFVGLAVETSPAIDRRVDYVGVKQVLVEIELGCVRTEGKLIQKLTTTDS